MGVMSVPLCSLASRSPTMSLPFPRGRGTPGSPEVSWHKAWRRSAVEGIWQLGVRGAPGSRAKSKSGEVEMEDWKDHEYCLPVPRLTVVTEGPWWKVFL